MSGPRLSPQAEQRGLSRLQALRSLGIDTQLVIYPDQFHGITKPSYKKDRLERYVGWYDRYLGPVKVAQ
jgi:dipeptidyl aminopeptidase/acylaminoacyl peptidase